MSSFFSPWVDYFLRSDVAFYLQLCYTDTIEGGIEMVSLGKITDQIFCFQVPYADIFVGIYVLLTPGGAVLFDVGATDADVENYICPALEQLGVQPAYIFISHNHADHAGGIAKAAACYPQAQILARSSRIANALAPEEGDRILDVLQVVTIPGHTMDSMALLDRRTNTLISGDCLQAYGIFGSGYWYSAIGHPAAYLEALEKVRALPLETVAAAHNYHPMGRVIKGQEAVCQYLDHCIGAMKRITTIAKENPNLDDTQLADLCNDGTLPKVSAHIAGILRKAGEEGVV